MDYYARPVSDGKERLGTEGVLVRKSLIAVKHATIRYGKGDYNFYRVNNGVWLHVMTLRDGKYVTVS